MAKDRGWAKGGSVLEIKACLCLSVLGTPHHPQFSVILEMLIRKQTPCNRENPRSEEALLLVIRAHPNLDMAATEGLLMAT